MNRGNRREDIFLTDKDHQLFVNGLADSFDLYHLRLLSMCWCPIISTCFCRHYKQSLASSCGIFWSSIQWDLIAAMAVRATFFKDGLNHCWSMKMSIFCCWAVTSIEEVVHQSIIGSADFIEWVRQKLPRNGQHEVPSLTKLQQHIVECIIGEVVKAGNAQADDLRDRKTELKDLRRMAMELSYR